MGNPKFRFSDMIPTWFPKLNHPQTTKKHNHPLSTTTPQIHHPHLPLSPPRKFYHFTRELRPKSKHSSSRPKHLPLKTNEEDDFIIQVDNRSLVVGKNKTGGSVSPVSASGHELRPIRTERNKLSDAIQEAAIDDEEEEKLLMMMKKMRSSPKSRGRRSTMSVNAVREDKESSVLFEEQKQGSRSVRRTGSPRFRIRSHSPRLARRTGQAHPSKGGSSSSKGGVSSKSLAVVKSSCDPQKDFKESMVEMIVENNITSSKDLEELLACYLTLNSHQYHDVIIQVFAQIWFDLSHILKQVN